MLLIHNNHHGHVSAMTIHVDDKPKHIWVNKLNYNIIYWIPIVIVGCLLDERPWDIPHANPLRHPRKIMKYCMGIPMRVPHVYM